MKRVSGREVIPVGTRPAIALRHEQNYTYDNVTLKEGIAQLGKHVEDQAGNKSGGQAKVWPQVSLMLKRSRFLGCGRTCLSDVAGTTC